MENAPSAEKEAVVKRREVAELASPLAIILGQLRERLDAGQYGAIIGDDSSGRIPALIMTKVMGEIYRTRGFPAPETRFVAGSGSGTGQIEGREYVDKTDALQEFVSGLGGGKRVLIVTEAIVTGKSLEPLMVALKLQKVPFDVATVGYDDSWGKGTQVEIKARFGAEVFAGGIDIYPEILNRPDLSGVKKVKSETHARPAKQDIKGFFFKGHRQAKFQRKVNEVRDDVQVVADELLDQYYEYS